MTISGSVATAEATTMGTMAGSGDCSSARAAFADQATTALAAAAGHRPAPQRPPARRRPPARAGPDGRAGSTSISCRRSVSSRRIRRPSSRTSIARGSASSSPQCGHVVRTSRLKHDGHSRVSASTYGNPGQIAGSTGSATLQLPTVAVTHDSTSRMPSATYPQADYGAWAPAAVGEEASVRAKLTVCLRALLHAVRVSSHFVCPATGVPGVGDVCLETQTRDLGWGRPASRY